MSKQIADLIENYDICRGYQRANTKEPMIIKEIPKEPWEILAIDIFFLLGNRYIIVVDTYSKFIEIDKLIT